MPHRNALLCLLSLDGGNLPSTKLAGVDLPKNYFEKTTSSFSSIPGENKENEADVIVFQPKGHPKQAIIDDEIWPPIYLPSVVRSAKRLQPKSTDVFVCTYPKCGTTWIQHICSQLMFSDYGPEIGKELCMTSPMIERMGANYANSLTHPRLLKTHFSWTNCPKSSTAKYIYAVRNPKDCLTSYFWHNRNFKIYNWENGDFDVFFELFIQGRLAFGDYFKHLKSWLPHINNPNVLFLKYEDMVADLKGTIQKIGKFLGGRAEKMVKEPGLLEQVYSESKIEAMKISQERWFPGGLLHQKTFIRKGGTRDWKNHLNKRQSDIIDRLFKLHFQNTEAADWWKEEMSWD